ncbi:helix-turn-helix transcriptional regulator [Rhizobium sp. AN80A]|uniref:helix-turn-helix domain-containing protein n=1 Tax=Rhizobium sp. AN80A TaxID=3040673 RepID=UPI0024B35E72|nr:helix-turn-helix transcriptional regulator [Rhizobium sp. AN80A]
MSRYYGNIEDSNVPTSLTTDLGEAVRAARHLAGYSIEQVAVTCGLTETEIAKVESGHEGDQRLVTRIAKALGMTATSLSPSVAA